MSDPKAEIVGEDLGDVFCPFCAIKLKGLQGGIKDKCPDCQTTFSVRKF